MFDRGRAVPVRNWREEEVSGSGDGLSEDQKRDRKAVIRKRGGGSRFIIYPFGEYGALTRKILNDSFGIQESYIIDNRLSKYNPNVKSLSYFQGRDMSGYTVLLTCANPDVYEEVRGALSGIFREEDIVDIFPKAAMIKVTECGKYSYGPLCNHDLVERTGAFSCFASGTDVVENHPVSYVSTHPFLYNDRKCSGIFREYDEYKGKEWYFPGVKPQGTVDKLRRIKIGNDVWLGRNVIITNGSDIGNGVIAGAGAIITKDVPDYAIVAGVPARIIRYRYTPEQISALNEIAWWDWPDEKIRECYEDFFEDIDTFICRHKKR